MAQYRKPTCIVDTQENVIPVNGRLFATLSFSKLLYVKCKKTADLHSIIICFAFDATKIVQLFLNRSFYYCSYLLCVHQERCKEKRFCEVAYFLLLYLHELKKQDITFVHFLVTVVLAKIATDKFLFFVLCSSRTNVQRNWTKCFGEKAQPK